MPKITKESKKRTLNPNYKLTEIYSADDIKGRHKKHFFSSDTMRFFKSRLIQDVFPTNKKSVYFVTSEKSGFTDETRVFNVRRYDIELDRFEKIETLNTRTRALSLALDLAYNETIGE